MARNDLSDVDVDTAAAGTTGHYGGHVDYKAAFQFGAGMSWEMTDKTLLDFSVRRYSFGTISTTKHDTANNTPLLHSPEYKLRSIQFQLGLRHHF